MLEKDRDAGRRVVHFRREPDRYAEERLHRDVERNAHALHGTAQDHAFAMQLDMPHPLVRHRIAGGEVEG